jgi:hypothetical protein
MTVGDRTPFTAKIRSAIGRARRGVAIAGVALAIGAVASVGVAVPAQAAITNGAQLEGEYGPIGNFVETSTGLYVYCIDSSADWPNFQVFPGTGTTVGSLDARDWAGSPAGVSGTALGRMNYIVANWGQTSDPVRAAAVQIALFSFTKGSVDVAKTYIGDADGNAATVSLLVDQMLADAANVLASQGGGSGSLTFTVDPTNNYYGTLTVNLSPASATGTVTLANGVFRDTGSSTISGVGNGAVLNVVGVAPEDDPNYKISASGTFTAAVWGNQINMTDYGSSGQQRMVTGAPGVPLQFTLSGEDPQFRGTVFQPAGTTVVPLGVVKTGDELQDVLQPTTLPDESGVNNSWKQYASGEYHPITYRATVYRVDEADYPSDPAGVAEIPASAVEVASTTITTTVEDGPTIEYPYSLGPAPSPGLYVIVIGVEYADQAPGTQLFLPEGYSWRDNFGQKAESILVPNITTKAKPDYLPGEKVWDEVIVSGPLPEGGVETIVYSYEQKPGARTLDELEDGAVCEPENLINESEPILITEPGTYRSEPFVANTGKDVLIAHVEVSVIPGTDTIVSEGECGDEEEMTLPRQPRTPSLALTGYDASPLVGGGLIAGGVLLVGAALFVTGRALRARAARGQVRTIAD